MKTSKWIDQVVEIAEAEEYHRGKADGSSIITLTGNQLRAILAEACSDRENAEPSELIDMCERKHEAAKSWLGYFGKLEDNSTGRPVMETHSGAIWAARDSLARGK